MHVTLCKMGDPVAPPRGEIWMFGTQFAVMPFVAKIIFALATLT